MLLLPGIFLCVIGVFVLWKRFILVCTGKKVNAEIVGYASQVRGMRGMAAFAYRVRYHYNGNDYYATALESAAAPAGSVPDKNLYRTVTIHFKEKNYQLVTIKEFKGNLYLGIGIFMIGFLCVIVTLHQLI